MIAYAVLAAFWVMSDRRPRLITMSPASPPCGPVRSAAVVNDEIRRMMVRSGGRLRPEQRPEYEALVAEWAAAVRGEVVKAA
ncbi:hypothetical protein [Streptomyces sp. NPDC055243]|uniref:hypothetical protein n=1 Tax=Streptomyces sp. NPDC055243 TaxID=3365720 RepID=UPI0037D32F6C